MCTTRINLTFITLIEKEADRKEYLPYGSIYMNLKLPKLICSDSNQINSYQGQRAE